MKPRSHTLEFTTLLAVLATTFAFTEPVAAAKLRSHGPVMAVGLTFESEGDLFIPSLGWRWQFEASDTLARWAAGLGTELTFAVEPLVGVISGDRDSIEMQVLPMLQLGPASGRDAGLVPYFEGGIGLIYSELRGFGLGSRILFTDNLGVGARLGVSGWSFGYRFRHISHAGLWADSNAGLNTHYLTINYAMGAPE